MIALLSSNIINIVHIQNLKSAQEIKNKKVHLFCVNNAVYSNDPKGKTLLMFDQLCIVTTDKALFFFEFTGNASFKFEEEPGQPDKGMPVYGGVLPEQMLWDSEHIFLGTKKAYIIMNKQTGQMVQNVQLNNQPYPQMTLSRGKFLVVNDNSHGFFVDLNNG